MTLLEGARSFATRGTDLGRRIDGLEAASRAAEGRLDEDLVRDASQLAARAAGRVRLSARHTVVAIAGATGSGKSTTFNALAGLDLSATGVRRPTTSWATACVWGAEGAVELLEWLGIPPRHQSMRDSMLDSRLDDHALEGVVLLDLPDHDSTEVGHQLEVDRLVQLADLLVWVLDPQKYADAAIHDRYLAPFREHVGVMLVVLNHIDTVPEDRRDSMVADLRRLLENDGLGEIHVVPISAREGIGVDTLRGEIAARVDAKRETRERLQTDLRLTAERLEEAGGDGKERELQPRRVFDLQESLAEAAGVPTVVAGAERVARRRLGGAVGWPPAVAVAALTPSRTPAELGGLAGELTGGGRASAATTVPQAQVDAELRSMADDTSTGMARPWADAVRRAALERGDEVGSRLTAALRDADVRADKLPGWAHLVRLVQWLLLVAFVGGAGWYVYLAVSGGLDDDPQLADQPLALYLAVGGLVLGVVLALVVRSFVVRAARARAQSVDERLHAAVRDVTTQLVVDPLTAELQRHAEFRAGLAAARE